MLITGSTQVSGAAQTPQISAPVFVFGRYPQMHGDSGPAAISHGTDGSGGVSVNGTTIAMTRGYDVGEMTWGATITNLNTRSRPGTGWVYNDSMYITYWAGEVSTDPYGMVGSCLKTYYYPYEVTWYSASPAFSVVEGTVYEYIAVVKGANSGWAALYGYLNGGGTWFNASTGALGTALGTATGITSTSLGDGWYEIRFFLTAPGSVDTANIGIYPGYADNDNIFAETANPSISRFYVSHTQCSAGAYAHPIIVSAGSAGTLSGTLVPDNSGESTRAVRWSATGTPVYNQPGPGACTAGVKTDGTMYFKGTSGPTLGTKDLVVALAMKWIYSANDQIHCGTRLGAAGLDGWQWYTEGLGYNPRLYLYDGTDAVFVWAPTLVSGQDVLLVATVNRDENSTYGAYAFANSTAGSGVNAYSVVQSITDDSPLTLFALGDGTADSAAGTVIYGAWVWEADNIFSAGATGAAEMQALASQLTQQYFGVYPQKAEAGDYTMTITRASPRYSQVGNVVYALGNGGQCMEMDDTGVYLGIYGARENLCLQSQTLTTTWTKEDAGDTLAATTITGDATDGNHGVTQAITVTAATYTFSAEAEPGNKNWLYLADSTVANCYAYFNVSTGAVGTVGAGAVATVVGSRGDKYRCAITFTGTAAAHTFIVAPAHADTDRDFSGDGATVNLTATNMQVELGACAGPIIVTTTEAVTKAAENVDIDTANIPTGDFTVTGEFRLPSQTTPPVYSVGFFWANTGGPDLAQLLFAPTTGYVALSTNFGDVTPGGITLTGAGNVYDGEWHRFVYAVRDGVKLFLRVDDTSDSSSYTEARTGAFTTAYIGRYTGDIYYLNGHIRNLVIYDEYYENA